MCLVARFFVESTMTYMTLILRLLFSALGLFLIAEIIPGITIATFYSAVIAALVLGLLNAVIRPILVVLTLPINILTLGLFTIIINSSLFFFASTFIEGFGVNTFLDAVIGSLLMSLVSVVGSRFISNTPK